MKIILADDFTGASDSAIKFKENDVNSKVIWDKDLKQHLSEAENSLISLDLDTRNLSKHNAYKEVKNIVKQLCATSSNEVLKKIDSTLRGNIAVEIDAILDSAYTEFIVVIPSYPDNHRIVRDGKLHIGDSLLEDTNFFKDIGYDGLTSSVKEIVSGTSKYKVSHLSKGDIENGMAEKIYHHLNDGVKIFTCDAETNNDMNVIYENFQNLNENFMWCGSAGLANCIAKSLKKDESLYGQEICSNNESTVISIGTTNNVTRKQLKTLLNTTHIIGIEVDSYNLIQSISNSKEIKKSSDVILKHLKNGKDVALFTNFSDEESVNLLEYKSLNNLNKRELGKKISDTLGVILKEVNKHHKIKSLIMSGGDTAKSIAEGIDFKEYHLIGSIEEGMPVGFLKSDNHQVLTVTKSGGFGTESSLINAYLKLGGYLKNEYNRDCSSDGYTTERESRN